MFKLHNRHLSSSTAIHSGHFMVSRVDDDEDDNNDAGDDSSESAGFNGQSFEIDVSNPDSVADAAKISDISYQVESPSAKNELVTSWNDLDRPAKRPHKQHHYLTYYTNSTSHHQKAELKRKLHATGDEDGPEPGASSSRVTPRPMAAPSESTSTNISTIKPAPISDDHHSIPVDATIDGPNSVLSNNQATHHHHTPNQPTRPISAGVVTSTASLAPSASIIASQYPVASTSANNLSPSDLSQMMTGPEQAGSASLGAIPSIDAYLEDVNEPRDLSSDSQGQLQMIAQQTDSNQLAVIEGQDELDEGQPRHAITIDPSLTKLLESMSLYYSHKLTSPKWKSFKGLKLRMKHKIRLNNLIWRAWFFQCIRGRAAPGCQFTAPPESDVHKKDESIVLEGKYWKRKEKAIVDEYKKWRIFHKQKSQIASGQMHCFRPSSFDWDNRVSNWASSSMYGGEYSLYDYDVNTDYHLDELTPMPDQLEPEAYYQPSMPANGQAQSMNTRMIEAPQQQQQQQQTMSATTLQTSPQQQHMITQMQVPSRVHENTHQHQHHQQQQLQQQQLQNHAHIQQQNQHHHQVLALKTVRSPSGMAVQQSPTDQMQQQQLGSPISISLANFSQLPHQQHQHPQHPIHLQHQQQHTHHHSLGLNQQQRQLNHHHHHQQQQPQQQPHQQQHHHQQQQLQSVPYAFENNAVYQQIQHQPHQLTPAQQVQQQQQQDQQNFLNQDLCSISSGASGSGSIISGVGGGRNEQRRVGHINAEQKRRSNIKNGFDTLRSILPTINHNVNVKVSKASMLQKAAVYISALTAEQRQQMEEQAHLRQQVEHLKQTILMHQSQLPSSGGVPGATVDSTTSSRARDKLQQYIRKRTLENWKFWIFSLVIEPMYESYYKTVNTNSLEEAFKTIYTWLDQNCGLSSMRKDVTGSLTVLSTNTNVLETPQTLPTEVAQAVKYPQQQPSSSGSSSSSSSSHNLNSQLIMPPTPTPSATSMQSSLSTIPPATLSSAQTPTPPISTLPPRSQHQHQHQQLQQFQMSQPVQPTSQVIQTHSIRSMW